MLSILKDENNLKIKETKNGEKQCSKSGPCTDNWYRIISVEDQSVCYVFGRDLPHHLIPILPDEIFQVEHLKTGTIWNTLTFKLDYLQCKD